MRGGKSDGVKSRTLVLEKNLRNFSKPLDKTAEMWYNNNVKRGTQDRKARNRGKYRNGTANRTQYGYY